MQDPTSSSLPAARQATKLACSVFVTLVLTLARPAVCPAAAEPPAASAAFTSTDKTVIKARRLVEAGNVAQAETLLRAAIPDAKPAAAQVRAEMLEIIRRLRIEYSLDADGLLAKIRKSIPDATPDEVQRWATASRARFRIIDGTKFFFRREPQNIFLFCQEARDRRAQAGNAPEETNWKLTDHLKAVIEAAGKSDAAEVVPVTHRVTYKVTIPPNSPHVKSGSVIRVWLPFPQEYRQQRNIRLLDAMPAPARIAPNGIDGNPVAGAPQRTVFFEQTVTNPTRALVFTQAFEYTSFAYYPKLDEAAVQPLPKDWNGGYLSERPPHIVFASEIRKEVARITRGQPNPLARARLIFRWVSANIPWNAEDEYCTIPSFALKGFRDRRGDCGIQNTLFITMCRIAGIPARWQSGFETKPGSWGMHDWAEIYIAPWGWLPADASYGVQDSNDPRVADFYCGHQDSYRLIVNLDWGRELVPPKTSLRSEPADFQRGEVEVDGKNLYFESWDYEMEREFVNRPE